MSNKEIIQLLLEKRGIAQDQQENFLHPDFERDTHDPFLMKGMDVAVERLGKALEHKEVVGVFGDYDADGVPATALLVRCLRAAGFQVLARIPTRASGYGLTAGVVEEIKKDKLSLLITVDNGTVAKEEVAALVAAGTDVIICDHHEPHPDQIATQALAILNPKQADCSYPFKELCACAIAWKYMKALYAQLGLSTDPLKWELDLVGLSTIADMVPLLGENRVLATYGLKVIRKTRNMGLRQLAAVAGVQLPDVGAGTIGFSIAPRINAPSRMHAETVAGTNAALQLLTTEDAGEAERLATYLNQQNAERQALLEQSLKEAEELAGKYLNDRCLIVYNADWSTGVIGLLAGRLLEKYSRPVIVLAQEDGVIKGSVRSVGTVHAVYLMEAGAVHLERYGGHAKAGGLTMKVETDSAISEFRALVEAWMSNENYTLESLYAASKRDADLEVDLRDIDRELAEDLEALEPHGIGFPAPLFMTTCALKEAKIVGKTGQHLSVILSQDGERRKGIGFGLGKTKIESNLLYRCYYRIGLETWNGATSVSCFVQRVEPV